MVGSHCERHFVDNVLLRRFEPFVFISLNPNSFLARLHLCVNYVQLVVEILSLLGYQTDLCQKEIAILILVKNNVHVFLFRSKYQVDKLPIAFAFIGFQLGAVNNSNLV